MNSQPPTKPKPIPFELLLNKEQIQKRVGEMGRELARDYEGKVPVFVGVMKGCMVFLADLIRHVNIPMEVEFISTSWYRKGTEQAGKIVLSGTFNANLRGRHVLIVEGIIDSGRTVNAILDHVRTLEPATIELVTLLDKPGSHRQSVNARYKGFSIGNEFVIGYGLDNTQKYRNLPYIGKVIEEK
ncbi:MAG: hypoxanthine phosphoribosyltransferase [Candidatus Zixiibacteriota bacterium]